MIHTRCIKNNLPIQFSLLGFIFFISLSFSSCNLKQNILFKVGEDNSTLLSSMANRASQNYTIEPNDYIAVSVYTNKGEILIDPNREFEIGNEEQNNLLNNQGGGNNGGQMARMNDPNQRVDLPFTANNARPNSFMINADGNVNIPMVGKVKLGGLTLAQADSILIESYSKYYEQPFVKTQYLSKRIILLGALGDRLIPLRYDNMNLLEILAISENFQKEAKANNIRIIRGDLKNPEIQVVDLTTIEGMKKANLTILPNDIIYVEPRRSLDKEYFANVNTAVSPFTTVLSAISTTLLLILTIQRLNE
jgi:polysaccharide export outer membrane protein